ncbi:hypothetical protein KCP73_19995 [Salmonella enterica subsp. enterica]|nr:hypothetical protein KCP73_19995 [Salmonella enterica subsp. enterica]
MVTVAGSRRAGHDRGGRHLGGRMVRVDALRRKRGVEYSAGLWRLLERQNKGKPNRINIAQGASIPD